MASRRGAASHKENEPRKTRNHTEKGRVWGVSSLLSFPCYSVFSVAELILFRQWRRAGGRRPIKRMSHGKHGITRKKAESGESLPFCLFRVIPCFPWLN